MNLRKAYQFTLNRIVFGDMLLNWFLGVVLTLFPSIADSVLGRSQLLPVGIYRVLGVSFLLFAAWQTYHVVRQQFRSGALIFAALAAEGPVVLLTIALVFMNFDLKPVARIALWVGDIYMLVLGGWYFYLSRYISLDPEDSTNAPETNPGR